MKQTTKRTLNDIVEAHLTSVISNSISIARHSKRRRHHNHHHHQKTFIHASDVLTALRMQGTPIQLPTNAGYTDNSPVDLNDFLEKESDPQIDTPSELGMVMHWLAVEGVQPKTPLNPVAVVGESGTLTSSFSPSSVIQQAGGDSNKNVTRQPTSNAIATPTNNNNNHKHNSEIDMDDNVTVRNLLPRLLSVELQLYFTRITLALQRENDTQAQDAALLRLRHDSGIQELVPFFLNFLTPTSSAQMSNVEQSLLRMYCVHNIVSNPNLHLELYLEKIVPLVLNCIVPKKLSLNDYDHWKLRDAASSALLSLLLTFGEKYTSFQSSVIRVLCQALTHGVESRYGALIALSGLGPKVVDAVILPCIGQFWVDSEEQLEKCNSGDEDCEGKRFALYRLQDALLVRTELFLYDALFVFLLLLMMMDMHI